MKSTIKSTFAVLAVALMVMVAVVPMVGTFVSDVVAAEDDSSNPYISDISVKIYAEDSTDLSGLLFKGTALPESLDATEWVNYGNNSWYNINENCEDYGKILTFGEAGFTADETVSYLRATKYYSLPVMQLTFTDLQDNYVGFKVYKAGAERSQTAASTAGEIKDHYEMTRSGAYFPYGVQSVLLEEIKASNTACINVTGTPGLEEGTYIVKVYAGPAASRTLVATETVVYGTENVVKIQGTVTDSNSPATTLYGAEITYNITDASGTTITGQKVEVATAAEAAIDPTLTAGKYTIYVSPGSTVDITNVALTGYTFATKTYSTATVAYTDIAVPTFVAAEKTLDVKFIAKQFNTEDTALIEGSTISASWVYWTQDTGSNPATYTITEKKPTGVTGGDITVISKTDINGKAKVSYTVPVGVPEGTSFAVYVGAGAISPFTYTAPQSLVFDEAGQAVPDTTKANLNAPNNDGVVANFTLNANEYAAKVHVKSAGQNGIAIKGVSLQATVYYSSKAYNGNAPVTVATNEDITSADVTKKATAVPYGKTNASGDVNVAFTLPTWAAVATTHTLSHAFILVSEKDGVSPYTFNTKTSVATSTTTKITDQIKDYDATGIIPLTTTANTNIDTATSTLNLSAEETVQDITVTVSKDSALTIGKYIFVTIEDSGFDTTKYFVEWASTTSTTVSFKMLSTAAPSFTMYCAGYDFTNNGSRVATGANSFATTVTAMTPAEFGLVVTPAVIGAENGYKIKAEAQAKPVIATFEFALDNDTSATSYKVTVMNNTGLLKVYGNPIYTVEEVAAVDAAGKVYEFDPTGASADPVQMKTFGFVAFTASATVTVPTVNNVVEDMTFAIVKDNVLIGTFTTDEYGIASVEAKADFDPITTAYNKVYYISEGLVFGAAAAETTGAFTGYYKIDVSGAVPAIDLECDVTFAGPAGHAMWSVYAEGGTVMLHQATVATGTIISLYADEIYYKDVTADQANAATLTQKMTFKGWYVNGILFSKDASASFIALDDSAIVAAYEAGEIVDNTPAAEKQPGIDNTTLIIGIVAVVIALIAVAFAVISVKKKDA